MRVELDAFSGRPNPTVQLTDRVAGEFRRLLEDLASASEPAPPPGLGYRGFVVDDDGVLFRAFGGVVETGGRALSDPERSVERWLLERVRLPPDARDRIAAEIDPPR